MEKTKIGVPVGLFGAGMYFMGLINIIPLVVMAGYVLIREENEWLRKAAVKALAVVLAFTVLSSLMGLVTGSTGFIDDIMLFGDATFQFPERFYAIFRLIGSALSLIQTFLLLMLGFKALKQADVAIAPIDKVIATVDGKDTE